MQLTLTTTPCACRRYLHSKGVVRWLEHPKERENVRLWRGLMEYYLVARWCRCLELLESHDAVGELQLFPVRPCSVTAASPDFGNLGSSPGERWRTLTVQLAAC